MSPGRRDIPAREGREKFVRDYIVHLHTPRARLEMVAMCEAEREVREVNVKEERTENYGCSKGRRRRRPWKKAEAEQ